MAVRLRSCEQHDNVIVAWADDYGRSTDCPLCKALEEIDGLQDQLEAARNIADDIKEQLDEANRSMKSMADSV